MSFFKVPRSRGTNCKKNGGDLVEKEKSKAGGFGREDLGAIAKRPKHSVNDSYGSISAKPFCFVTLTESNVKPGYHMVFPSTLYKDLPREIVPATIAYDGKTWDAILCVEEKRKRLDGRWKFFVEANGLAVGDTILWEVLESNNKRVKFKVEIFKSGSPSISKSKELKLSCASQNAPIILK